MDGEYGSVAGMCLGDEWAGDPARGIPGVARHRRRVPRPGGRRARLAFSRTWARAGAPAPPDEVPDPRQAKPVGDVSVRVVEGVPAKSRIYRLSQFLALAVEERLWITDPYFLVPPAMSRRWRRPRAAGWTCACCCRRTTTGPSSEGMSRAGYRPLLEAGVRIFEWEGPMIHAKTAVADGVWARVGSSNQNLASLLGNWELDVAVTDRHFAEAMEALFEADLSSAVEVGLLTPPSPRRRSASAAAPSAPWSRRRARRPSRAAPAPARPARARTAAPTWGG